MASQIRKRIKLPGYKLNKRPGLKTQTIIEQEARLRRLVSHILRLPELKFLDKNDGNLCLLLI